MTPAQSLMISPEALLVPLGQGQGAQGFQVHIKGADAPVSFRAAGGWSVRKSGDDWVAERTEGTAAGLAEIEASVGSQPAFQITPSPIPISAGQDFLPLPPLKILSLDLKLPEGTRVGYIGGGADRVGLWLARMGLDVTELDAQALAGDLSSFTTIVVGIFAFGIRRIWPRQRRGFIVSWRTAGIWLRSIIVRRMVGTRRQRRFGVSKSASRHCAGG